MSISTYLQTNQCKRTFLSQYININIPTKLNTNIPSDPDNVNVDIPSKININIPSDPDNVNVNIPTKLNTNIPSDPININFKSSSNKYIPPSTKPLYNSQKTYNSEGILRQIVLIKT